jgi:3-oxoacyl-[acyl-carrier protein] reductase
MIEISKKNGPLANQVALVTGCGRTTGIGRGIAHALAAQSADLAVADITTLGTRNADERADADAGWRGLDSLVEELTAQGTRALAVLGDVGSRQDAERMVRETLDHYGRIDILVNNAAAPHGEDCRWIWEVPEEAYDTVMRVNAKGVFLMSTAVTRHFLSRGGGGRIVNISSDAGKQGAPQRGPYSASKFAIIGLTQVMARELAAHGITVNAICPGFIDTARHVATSARAASGEQAAGSLATLAGVVPRVGTPDDIGHAVAFLAHPSSGYINGQSLIVDGGLFMS